MIQISHANIYSGYRKLALHFAKGFTMKSLDILSSLIVGNGEMGDFNSLTGIENYKSESFIC